MSLQVWLPLTGDLHNQGCNNPSISLTSGNTWAFSGKIGNSSLTLTKLQTILPTSSCMTGAKEVSYCYWVKVNTAWSTNWLDGIRWIETNGSTTSTARQEFYTNCTLVGTWYKGGSISGKAFTPGVWTHLAATFNYNTGEANFYIDGILKGTTTNIDKTYYCRGDFYIGDNGVDICQNDVRIYDHALSAAEVHEIAQGLVLHYKLDDPNSNMLKTIPKSYDPTAYCGYQLNFTENLVSEQTYTLQLWDVLVEHSAKTAAQMNLSVYWGGGSVRLITFNGSSNFKILEEHYAYSPYLVATFTVTSSQATGSGSANAWFNLYNSINNASGTRNMHIGAWKLEKGNVASSWIDSEVEQYAQDSSGYSHHGTITGDVLTVKNSARYNSCLYSEQGTNNYIETPILNMPTDAITMNIWFKSANNAPVSGYHMVVDSIGDSTARSHYEMCVSKSGVFRAGLYVNGARKVGNCGSATGCNGQWHMLTVTYDGAAVKRYYDGVMESSTSAAITTGLQPTAALRLFKDGQSSYACMEASLSDFRIYAAALSDEDVLSLYHTSAKVDNLGKVHTFEINENNVNKLTKTGILHDNMIESIMTLPDGSCWQLLLFHYVDGGNNLFTEDNAAYCNEFGLFSRLRDIDNFKYTDTTYEFYVIQDDVEYRWTQTNAPTASKIEGLTTVSGYANPVNGIAKATNNGSSYLGYGTWWGACGAWTLYTTGGKTGIPSFGAHNGNGICTRYLALYARIPKASAKLANETANTSNFIEL